MFNALNREAILELVPPCDDEAGHLCVHGDCAAAYEGRCPRRLIEWLLRELAKPREERRDYNGRLL